MSHPIQKAFAPLHASEHTLEEVIRMKEQKQRTFRTARRAVLIAAAALVSLTFTAFAADYVIHGREVFFFDTITALTKQYEKENPGAAVAVAQPLPAAENEEMETSAEYVARALENGLFDDETVLEQSEEGGVRRRVAECHSDAYGDIVSEYLASPEYAQRIAVDGVIDWALTPLPDALTPDEGGQLLTLIRSEDGKLLCAKAHAGYTTADGERFTLNWEYNEVFPYGQPEYILNSAYDHSELFTTDDGVEVLLLAYDGQVWARAASGCRSMDIYTTACTVEEMRELLNALTPSAALAP